MITESTVYKARIRFINKWENSILSVNDNVNTKHCMKHEVAEHTEKRTIFIKLEFGWLLAFLLCVRWSLIKIYYFLGFFFFLNFEP